MLKDFIQHIQHAQQKLIGAGVLFQLHAFSQALEVGYAVRQIAHRKLSFRMEPD